MKFSRCLIGLAMAWLTPSAALAQTGLIPFSELLELEHSLQGGITLGAFLPSQRHELYDNSILHQEPLASAGFHVGLRLAYMPIQLVGVEFEAAVVPTSAETRGDALLANFVGHLIVQYPLQLAGQRITPFALVGYGALGISSSETTLGNDFDAATHWGGGVKWGVLDRVDVRIDYRQMATAAARTRGYTVHFEVLAGATFHWEISPAKKAEPIVVADPVVEKPDEARPAVLVEIRDGDPDNDGVEGAADRCPDQAGDPPDGCPSTDSDGDGIRDIDDRCKDEAEDLDTFEDSDGCPEPDNDRDGILDGDDKCPNVSETLNGVEDTDGCPEELGDKDSDGLLDAVDKCVDEPEDKDGFEDTDGCPDWDNDQDNVADNRDSCPDVVGSIENLGCPETDTDGDGLVDRLDNCPNENGPKRNGGCKARQLVRLRAEKIEILQKVFFRTSRTDIRRQSHALLNNMVKVLKAHPEIQKLQIAGHTDNAGPDDFNRVLSQGRANAVRNFLVLAGIAPERLTAIGYGEDKPLGTNKTKAGRAKNRRVDFNIVREEPEEPEEPEAPAP